MGQQRTRLQVRPQGSTARTAPKGKAVHSVRPIGDEYSNNTSVVQGAYTPGWKRSAAWGELDPSELLIGVQVGLAQAGVDTMAGLR